MNTTTPPRGARIHVELDREAAQALGRAARDMRLSKPAYARSIIAKHLRDLGALPSALAEAAR